MNAKFSKLVLTIWFGLIASFCAQAAENDVETLIDSARNLDINEDGIHEINQMEVITDWSVKSCALEDKLLVVLIEDRLLTHATAEGDKRIFEILGEYCRCLGNDGWKPLVIRASVYDGEIHQDGRTLLAIRRFFQATKKQFPNFGGAILIGSFPESMLVRRWVWKHSKRSATFNGVAYNKGKGPKATFVALDPELISHRSDVVLCDLDGNWEDIYVQPKTEIDSIKFLPDDDITSQKYWPRFTQTIKTDKFTIRQKSFEDFFFIDDAQLEILVRTGKSLTLKCGGNMLRPEVGEPDRKSPNPLAEPDIMVSRMNPRHVGVIQPAKNLDVNGKPKPASKLAGSPNRQFVRDNGIERQLLVEYLLRNIAHRRGQTNSETQRVASMWTDLQTPSKRYFAKVSKELGGTISFPKADAVDFVRFMKTPAIIKGISAHSNPGCSVLMKGYKQEILAKETGGNYWFWKESGDQYVPTYNHSSVRDRVHFSLLRTLWENNMLQDAGPAFYVHGGCEAISPYRAANQPFNSPTYGGHNQIAENLLFYGNGLALIGRAKVYFDIPRGFDSAFGVEQGNFGNILKKYFEVEANDAKLARSVASRNRTYFWSIIGDWTLRLKY